MLDHLIYINKEDCLSVCLCLSLHSHSFHVTKLKLFRQVKDLVGQVVEVLTILRYPGGSRIKGL